MSTPGPPKGGDQSKAPTLRGVLSSELAVATIIVALRFFTRLRLTRNPGWDDWIMLGTFVCSSLRYTLVKNHRTLTTYCTLDRCSHRFNSLSSVQVIPSTIRLLGSL